MEKVTDLAFHEEEDYGYGSAKLSQRHGWAAVRNVTKKLEGKLAELPPLGLKEKLRNSELLWIMSQGSSKNITKNARNPTMTKNFPKYTQSLQMCQICPKKWSHWLLLTALAATKN